MYMTNMDDLLERYSRVMPTFHHLQQMKPKTEGITVTLSSVTQTVQTPDGGTRKVTYRQGEPEFDAYVAKQEALCSSELTLPKNFMFNGVGKDGITGAQLSQRIARRQGIFQLELPREYPSTGSQRSIYASYNTIINYDARNNLLVGNMLDENMVPPEGFRFFYKGNESGMNRYPSNLPSDGTPESAFDGILHVWHGDWSYTGRVPVRQDATRFPVSVNMYDTIARSGADIPGAIISALKNFDFFTVVQSGNYFPSHPRR